jgi:hypothetical protein
MKRTRELCRWFSAPVKFAGISRAAANEKKVLFTKAKIPSFIEEVQ